MKEGHKYFRLTTVKKVQISCKKEKIRARWLCKCECGNLKIIDECSLYGEKGVKSCGCVGKKRFGKDRFTQEFIKQRVNVNENDCWIWKGSKHRQGYGNVTYKEKLELAHRVSWMIYYGEIPEGIKVCHHCDEPSCVNPAHLFLGTQLDNMADCIKKGRFTRNIPKTRRIKLNFDQVQEIKMLNEKGITRKELQEKFNVGQTCIAKILQGKSWNINWTQEL